MTLDVIYAGEEIAWLDLVHSELSDQWPSKTVENVIYELVAFGAVHRVGQAGTYKRPDTRALRPTPLGRAWLDQELLEPLDDPYDPEDP